MISPEKASKQIGALIPQKRIGRKALYECVGMNMAVDVISSEYVPPFTRSPLDGYAFDSQETKGLTSENVRALKILEVIPAGKIPQKEKLPGTTVKVMTGAMIPPGFDAVLPWEEVERSADGNTVVLNQEIAPGTNTIPQGEDIQPGETVIAKGSYLTPSHVGVLATLGISQPKVYLPYKIGILVTGSELLPAHTAQLPAGKIRCSNNFTLGAAIRSLGQETVDFGVVNDSYDELEVKIEQSIGLVDFLITTGGVSRGDYDFVPHVLEKMGANRLFWRVNMKPGTPIHAARYKKMPIISLSGNPAACMATYHLLLAPLLTGTGTEKKVPNSISARCKTAYLQESIHKKTSRVWRFVRGRGWIGSDGFFYCEPIAREKPSMQKTLMWSNGYIVLPPGQAPPPKGEKADFIFSEFNGWW